jgi:hypothetical protein
MMAATQSQAWTGVKDAWFRIPPRGENGGGVRDAPGIDPAVSFGSACSDVSVNGGGVRDAPGISPAVSSASACSDVSVNTHIQWACVARDETLLAVVGNDLPDQVLSTARNLLNKKPTIGWDSYQQNWRGGCKGLKFHVYQEGADKELMVWTFACVYDSARNSKRQAQSFLEKIVVISEMWREADDSWKEGRHLACQHLFGPVLQQRMQEFSYLGDMAVVDNEFGISGEVVATNRNLINRKYRDPAKDWALAQEEALLRKIETLNREVLAQDLHEQETREEALLKQMEEMNKEVLRATEKAKSKEEQATEEEDELDQVWHSGRAYYPPSGATSVLKDFVAPTEHADVTFDESESEDEDGYLEDGAMTAILRLLDDEFYSTGKSTTKESVTSKTSFESSSSNHGEEKVREFEVLLDELEQATSADPVQDILLGKLDGNEEDEVSPTRVDGIERMLRDLEGDVWGGREVRMRSEVREDASALTEIPVEQKEWNCFLITFFSARKSALA